VYLIKQVNSFYGIVVATSMLKSQKKTLPVDKYLVTVTLLDGIVKSQPQKNIVLKLLSHKYRFYQLVYVVA